MTANLLVGITHLLIPFCVWYAIRHHRGGDIPFRGMLTMFATFSLLCGLARIADVFATRMPVLTTVIDVLCILASAPTAAIMLVCLPILVRLRTPEQIVEILRRQTEIETKLETVCENARRLTPP